MSAIIYLTFLSVNLCGQEFRIFLPDPDISGVTTVNMADLNNDQILILWHLKVANTPREGIYLWMNQGDGMNWTRKIIDPSWGMYYGVAGDLGHDGDMDIVGPNTYSRESKIIILENITISH
jgi:hypothetical protein